MDKITKHIICELTGYSPSTISVSQGDRMAREISCRLLENGVPWLVPAGSRVVAAYTLPDGTRGSYDTMPDGSPAWAVAGNIITVALIDPLTMLPGAAELSIVLLGGEGQQLAVWPIRLTVVGDKKLTIPENLPPLGAGYAGRILYGGPGGLLTPLGLGDGVRVERRDDGSLWLVAVGGGSGSGGGISKETDPTVPDWAKQPNKPSYTAQEVGALPAGTKIPANTSDLSNDSGFITRAVTDLQNYYTQAQTRELLAQIPRFRVTVVQQLPAAGEELVLYLVPFADAQGQYLEYIWVGGQWEVIGSQQVDLDGYATEEWVKEGYQPKGDYLTKAPVSSVNGKTGAVVLGAGDVGARPDTWVPTAQEVGALPAGTKIPAKTSDLSNDSGFITRAVTDLQNYYTQAQTRELLAQIPRFRVTVVQQLPAAGEELVLYLVPFADAQGQYLEYIWVGGQWEVIGSQQVDLDGYATEDWVREGYQPKGNYLTKAPVESVNGKIGAVVLGASDVGARPDTWVPTAQEVGADPKGTAASAVSVHNISGDAHSDLRLAVQKLQAAVDAFLDVDDTTRDSLSEVLALIDANADVIEAITTSKVSVSDIVNNLTTNVANRPLSAAQGVALKALFDKVPAWALAASKPGYTKSEVGLSNVDNVRQYSVSNPPPYPVTSVNGKTGAVTVDVPTMVSQLTNDSKFISAITDAMITAALGYTPINPGKATLGRHTDGLLYLFVDSKPVGTGVELPTGGIDGYITEDKQIVFNNLPDGEYTLAYLMDDGSIVTIGELVKDTNTYYSITNNLTNCTNSNSATQVVEGESYSATITANSGYELESVTVTMGGVDITATAVSGTEINIASVSGDIVITAVAVEAVNTPGYTNLAKNFTSGRFNSSGAITTSTLQNSVVCEDYIPFEAGTTVRIKGLQMGTVDSVNHCVQFTNSSKVNLATSNHSYPGENGSKTINWKKETDEVYQYNNVSNADCTYMRVSGVLVGSTADVIITVNEEIIGSEITVEYTNLLPLATDTDGSLFVGPNGEAGYKPNTRMRMSNGEERTVTGIEATGFIPVKYKQTLYIKGITIACPTSETTEGLCFYNSSREFICGAIMAYAFGNTAGDVASCMVYDTLVNGITADADIAYARMSATEIGPDSIVTVNEPLE